jgi:hypothetical protein
VIEQDDVARVQCQSRGRQTERGTFSANPSFHQRATTAAFGLFGRDCHREAFRGDARCIHRDAACFHLGTDRAQMALVANRLAEVGGGVTLWRDGQELALVELPIARLMSDRPAREVADKARRWLQPWPTAAAH